MSTLREALGAILGGQEYLCKQQGEILATQKQIVDWMRDHDRYHQAADERERAGREDTARQREMCAKHFARVERALELDAAANAG